MVGKCTVDGVDIYSTYNVGIEKVTGLHDFLKIKNPQIYDWKDEHGVDVYLDEIYYEPREIILQCFISGVSATDFQGKLKDFFACIASAKLKYIRLASMINGYLVYLDTPGTVTRLNSLSSSRIIARFNLRFIEPYPINRQFFSTSSMVGFTITCSKLLTIWWGDGTKSTVIGTNQVKTKNYGTAATRYIVIYGSIESITSLSVVGADELDSGTITVDSTDITADQTDITADQT